MAAAGASDEEQRGTMMVEMWRQSVAPFSLGHNNIFRRVPGKWQWLFFQLPTNQPPRHGTCTSTAAIDGELGISLMKVPRVMSI